MSDYSAIYIPSLPPQTPDPSKSGFSTIKEAQEFVFANMCKSCTEQRRMFLAGIDAGSIAPDDDTPDEWPACYFEWSIEPTENVDADV